jgi:hypothetical protein
MRCSTTRYADEGVASAGGICRMKSSLAGLHEVLLNAALRGERMKADREADQRARELAQRNDKYAELNRVPEASQETQR